VRAALFAVPCAGRAGHSAAAGVRAGPGPLRFRVCHGGVVLVPARTCWFPWWPGSARYPSRRWRAQRALGPGKGPEGVRGNRGNRALGGLPGSPGALQVSASGRCGAVFAAGAVHLPCSFARRGPSLFSGGGRRGLGNLEPGPCFSGAGGGSGFTSAFPDWSPLLSVYSCSRAVVFLTSTTLLFEGLRSGTRRRRGASASAQAGGETGPETRRTAPARAGRSLYAHCPGHVRAMCPKAGLPAPPSC